MIKKYKIPFLVLILLVVNTATIWFFFQFRFSSIVVHHSASRKDNYASIKAYHQSKGWLRDAAYHLILSNGSTEIPLGYIEATGRYRNLSYALATKNIPYNLKAIHICVVGNYHEKPAGDRMKTVLAHALRTLMEKYHMPGDRIVFHRDIGSTVCPGRHITKEKLRSWIATRAKNCPPQVKQQQLETINRAGFSIHTFPKAPAVAMLLVSLLIALGWVIGFRRHYRKTERRAPGEEAGLQGQEFK